MNRLIALIMKLFPTKGIDIDRAVNRKERRVRNSIARQISKHGS